MKSDKPDNKAKFLEKFDQPAKPVITQVVPVGEELPKKPAKSKDEPKDHFNVFLSKPVGKALRIHKINTGESVQDILERIVIDYLVSKGELPTDYSS
ncbi:hypothetical protein [Spirosoma endophyticum]|uniref:Uncharacterized protein n=1 Tax=Spirosoma endophyticum TaxID=662367 RepID=A0A1I2HU27_9BACT|nr:hypothetical protein [Spirosoma endophyticum]SFF32850.1 hypothetical protein SAMN05216167_14815 [Spirosoma endophyticum]